MITPVETKDEKASKKQTLVWFHGGAFIFGGIDYYGAEYVMEFDDVILVTVQYRLNAFGFMSTEDKAAPGNYGSLDQAWPPPEFAFTFTFWYMIGLCGCNFRRVFWDLNEALFACLRIDEYTHFVNVHFLLLVPYLLQFPSYKKLPYTKFMQML